MCTLTLKLQLTYKWDRKAATNNFSMAPVLPQWSNLVQFDFQQKHPGRAIPHSPLHLERAQQIVRTWGVQ